MLFEKNILNMHDAPNKLLQGINMERIDSINAMCDVCDAFLEAFRRCDPEKEPNSPSEMALPAIVCAAFSAEVGLKILLRSCGIDRTGHDLLKLYQALPAHLQTQIQQGTTLSVEEFTAELNNARHAFKEWRYLYESKVFLSVSVEFLRKFSSVIQFICSRIRSAL